MTLLRDETKRTLTYVLVTIAGGLLVLNGLQEERTTLSIAGGGLAVTALGLLVAEWA